MNLLPAAAEAADSPAAEEVSPAAEEADSPVVAAAASDVLKYRENLETKG